MKLSIQNLTKTYANGVKAIDNLSLEIGTGMFGLLGPNGAGKSTCFYMLAGLIKVDRGSIALGDMEITDFPMHKRSALGLSYLPQESSVFRELSSRDNLVALIEQRKDLSKRQRDILLDKITEDFGLKSFENILGRNLSGGERRRLEIARSITSGPRFILLDEPFAGIDPISLNDIKAQIKQLQSQGIGVLITDHNVRETLDICDRAYIVSEGQIIASGGMKQILENETVKRVYLGDNFS